MESKENSYKIEKNGYLYCHFYLNREKGVLKTVKLPLENFNMTVIEVKSKIAKILERQKDASTPFKIMSLNKTINSPVLLDTIKISQFFRHQDEIFCGVEMNITPIKTAILDDVLKYKSLSSYSFWVASKQIVKVRVPLKGVENLPKENITSSFTESSLDVKIHNLNGLNYHFGVPRLDAKIVPEKSEVLTDKEGNIIIRLRKAKEDDHWSYLFKQKYVGEN
jgi:hypothetical protein